MRYAPLADTRLVAAVFVFRPYAAKPIGASGCQGCAAPSAGRPGLDAGASGDYREWPSQGGKPQRPEAGQGGGLRAAPTPDASPAMGSLPRVPIRGTQPGSKRPIEQQSVSAGRGVGAPSHHAVRQPTPALPGASVPCLHAQCLRPTAQVRGELRRVHTWSCKATDSLRSDETVRVSGGPLELTHVRIRCAANTGHGLLPINRRLYRKRVRQPYVRNVRL